MCFFFLNKGLKRHLIIWKKMKNGSEQKMKNEKQYNLGKNL